MAVLLRIARKFWQFFFGRSPASHIPKPASRPLLTFKTFKVMRLIRVTPGRRHGWYETNVTNSDGSSFLVRKPLNQLYNE